MSIYVYMDLPCSTYATGPCGVYKVVHGERAPDGLEVVVETAQNSRTLRFQYGTAVQGLQLRSVSVVLRTGIRNEEYVSPGYIESPICWFWLVALTENFRQIREAWIMPKWDRAEGCRVECFPEAPTIYKYLPLGSFHALY